MTSAMVMLDRGATAPSLMTGGTVQSIPGAAPGAGNVCMLPRCEVRVEKCERGLTIRCICDDEVACGALQNLCKMLAAGQCSCCCTWNGMTVCQCNLCCGNCTCEMTKDGVCFTCKSGDEKCCDMLQACCDCLSACLEAGCCCYVCLGNTPVCCGTC